MNRMHHTDVRSLQQPDGSFAGDEWGEIDTRCCTSLCFNTCCSTCFIMQVRELRRSCSSSCRFSYCALSCCRLLGQPEAVDVASAVRYVARCQNIDGGFGCTPGRCILPPLQLSTNLPRASCRVAGLLCFTLSGVAAARFSAVLLQAMNHMLVRYSHAWLHWRLRTPCISLIEISHAGGARATIAEIRHDTELFLKKRAMYSLMLSIICGGQGISRCISPAL